MRTSYFVTAALLSLVACSSATTPSNPEPNTPPTDDAGATLPGDAAKPVGSSDSGDDTPDVKPVPLVKGAVCQWAKTYMAANPLLSAGRPVVTNVGEGHWLTDGEQNLGFWEVANPTPAKPGFAAFDVGKGPSKLGLRWTGITGAYEDVTHGAPTSYRIETSATSTNGKDGDWTAAVTVNEGTISNGAHVFDFRGKRWVRFVVTGASPKAEGTSLLNEIQIFDASRGLRDSWVFFGDSITAMSLSTGANDSVADWIHHAKPAHYPLMISGGTGGTHSGDAVEGIDSWLRMNPDVTFFALAYGTNDAAGDPEGKLAGDFEARLRTLLDKIIAAGKVPVMPRIPAQKTATPNIEKYNLVIDKLQAEYGLCKGPDLYTHFAAHKDELADGVHPGDKGSTSLRRLWGEAMLPLYP